MILYETPKTSILTELLKNGNKLNKITTKMCVKINCDEKKKIVQNEIKK